jgi:hypothetical protein
VSAETVGLFHDGELGSIPQRWLARARDLPSSKTTQVVDWHKLVSSFLFEAAPEVRKNRFKGSVTAAIKEAGTYPSLWERVYSDGVYELMGIPFH